jgi:hypothetical protein
MSDQLFERAVRDWLDAGSDRTPPPAIDAVLLAVKSTPQERDLRIPRRFFPMPISSRLAAVIALAAVAGLGAFAYFGTSPNPLPTPTATPAAPPSPSPSPPAAGLDTVDWISFTSERYGFDVKRPPEFTETPATSSWDLADADTFPAPGTEDFYFAGAGDGLGVRVSAWSFVVEPGTTLESFVQTYCVASAGTSCATRMDAALPVTTLDGDEGVSLAGPNLDSQVFVLVDDRVYMVAAWRTDNDPSVAPFGGGRRLVEAFASTLTLRPDGPAPDAAAPALDGSFTSTRYGYSIAYPSASWAATAAAELWAPTAQQDLWSDTFLPPSTNNGFRAASALIPGSVPQALTDDWIAEVVTGEPGPPCMAPRSTLSDIVIDGQTGKVRINCEEIEATLVVDGRLYLFTLFLDDGAPYDVAGGRALFEAMMATVQLTPETAEVAPTPAAS